MIRKFGLSVLALSSAMAIASSAFAQCGTVKSYSVQGGYGFIKPDLGNQDVLVMKAEVLKAGLTQLEEGQYVCFDAVYDKNRKKAPMATNLELP
jgi:cold shock CspA family protein